MKKLVVTTMLLLVMQARSWAGTDPLTQQLLVIAERQADLFHQNPTPIQLEVSFVAQIQTPTRGALVLRWADSNRWWRKVVMNGFEQVDIRNGEKLYTRRNLSFTPYRILELAGLLQFAGDSDGLFVTKRKERVENGIGMNCLQVKVENNKGRSHEICIAPGPHDIVSHQWKEPPDELCREQFADYFDFGSLRYPRDLELFVNGSKVLSAHVDDLKDDSFDDSLLIPPQGAIERRQCAAMTHAIPVSTPDPLYPKSASENKLMGDSVASMTVLTDGSVADIHLLESAGHSMDEATLQTLRRWRFKPAKCGTEPVVSDIQVLVSFRTQ